MYWYLTLFILFLLPITVECNDMPISTGSIFSLTADSVKILKEKADVGDVESAYQLYQYYTLSNLDESQSIYWLEISAKLGHAIAQYNLAVHYEQNNDDGNALHWGNKAFLNGNEKAKRFTE